MSLVGSPISSPPGTSYDHGRRVSGASIASLTLPRNTSTYTSYYIQPEEGNLSREEMTEMYHALIKEKRELRKRNAQAQTNIVQYFRKHKMDLFSGKTESNPEHLKEEYSNLLQKMVSLNDKKMKENTELGLELEAIAMKKHEMDEEVSRLNKEIHQSKIIMMKSIFTNPEEETEKRSPQQKILSEHAKAVHIITEKMRPHRLEMIKLQEKLQWLERRYKEVCQMSKENSEMSKLSPYVHLNCYKGLFFFLEKERKIQINIFIIFNL
ncbi:uncharacterized protein [Lepeophtheirus salmonis]|uniref:uncharacterized protein n=1 Tax=Lepeophtheirus salmonis TaxID=72036 RepID=UPI003AF3D51E